MHLFLLSACFHCIMSVSVRCGNSLLSAPPLSGYTEPRLVQSQTKSSVAGYLITDPDGSWLTNRFLNTRKMLAWQVNIKYMYCIWASRYTQTCVFPMCSSAAWLTCRAPSFLKQHPHYALCECVTEWISFAFLHAHIVRHTQTRLACKAVLACEK